MLRPPAGYAVPSNSLAQVPIVNFIVKVVSQCNLNCRYCYMYNKGDDSYRFQPHRMSAEVVRFALSRVASYCLEENLTETTFIFHGGEPLLAGMDFFRRFVREAAEILGLQIKPNYVLETNGTLLASEWLDMFRELGISFGISLDGPEATNDRSRVNHAGDGSYESVRRALDVVVADRRLDKLFGGVLTVIDLSADPLDIYHHWREIGIRRCDFLLPDGTYDNPPPGISIAGCETPYADWLINIFDEWFHNEDTTLSIRLFEEIIGLLFESGAGNDAIGGGRNGLLVIETDGGIEPVDVLKICGPAFTKLDLNVLRNEIHDVYSFPLVNLYHQGASGICETCRRCPVVNVCGGGYLPHRYSLSNGFANPSVYCRDLMKLITHVRNQVLTTIPEPTRQKLRVEPLSFEHALARLHNSALL
jgi:uncharacterized protein